MWLIAGMAIYVPSGASAFNRRPVRIPPAKVETIIFQLAIPVHRSITAPISMASVEVSPIEPGIKPINISIKDGILSNSPAAACASGVAPEKPSTIPSPFERPSIQILSPDICEGYAKNTNALERRAGFQIFIPVPPNTSFPTITAKITERARIQRGTSTGIIRGISIPVTR